MGDISVRRLEDDVLRALKARAARHGVSMEEEVRRIIKEAIRPSLPTEKREKVSEIARRYFGPENGLKDFELPSRGEPHEPIDFSK